MKAYLREWAYECKNLPAWFKNDHEIEVSLEMIQELYETGNNVMLSHTTDVNGNPANIIFVDSKRFTQR